MNVTNNLKLVAFSVLIPVLTMAAPATPTSASGTATTNAAASSTETVALPSESKLFGQFEVRPSYTTQMGEFHTEDTIEGGYQFNKNLKLSYVQWFKTNLMSPLKSESGLGLGADDGVLRLRASDIWKSADGATSLKYQARLYAPTNKAKRENGFITTIRNGFTLVHEFNETFTSDFSIVPIIHGYSRAGNTVGGVSSVNPAYEQMFVLNTDVKISPKLTFSLPILNHYTKYRSFAGAKMSDKWGQTLWVWPELAYEVDGNSTIGVAYYSDNLIDSTGNGLTIGSGLEKGVGQMFWTLSL